VGVAFNSFTKSQNIFFTKISIFEFWNITSHLLIVEIVELLERIINAFEFNEVFSLFV